MRRALILALLTCLLAGCSLVELPAAPTATTVPTATAVSVLPTAQPKPTDIVELPAASPTNAPTSVGASSTPSQTLDLAKAESELAQIESDTEKLRGLTPKHDVPEHFISQQQLRDNLTTEIKQDYSPEEAKRDATTLWMLRLMDNPNVDLYQLQIDLLGEQVLGYYDQKKNELFVLNNQSDLSPLSRETLSHEFVHSLQDEYYDLEKLNPEHGENDSGLAAKSLIEGDATLSGLLYAHTYMDDADYQNMINQMQSGPTNVLDRAPRYITESLLFPYNQGADFVLELLKQTPGSFQAVDEALADPPHSTEQIMHPEKYLATPRDEPVSVSLPPLTDTLGTGWKQSDTDTLGEFDLSMMLELNGVTDSEASAGWGGARYAIYQSGDSSVILMLTAWDTPKDATEFNAAMLKTFNSLSKTAGLWSDGKRYFGLKNSGGRVAYVGGTDQGAAQKVMAAVKP